MSEDEAVAEAERLTALGMESEALPRPDRPGEWYVSIGGALQELSAPEFSRIATETVRQIRKDG